MAEPLTVGALTISTKAEGGVLVADREGRTVLDLADREAAALAVALLRAVPKAIGVELCGTMLGELLEVMPEGLAIELGLAILARHQDALGVMAAFNAAERRGGVGSA